MHGHVIFAVIFNKLNSMLWNFYIVKTINKTYKIYNTQQIMCTEDYFLCLIRWVPWCHLSLPGELLVHQLAQANSKEPSKLHITVP